LQKGVAATDWSWAPLMADFDNNGTKDMYISNGYRYRLNDLDFNSFVQGELIKKQQQNIAVNKYKLIELIPDGNVADYFYLNKGEDGFMDASVAAGFIKPTLSNGATFADLDKDGRLDLIVSRINEPAAVYKNNMPSENYVNIILKGNDKNTFGIGAKIYAYSADGIQLYSQYLQRGFMSSVSSITHIGIGKNKTLDSVLVVWPGGKGEMTKNIAAGNSITLLQKNALLNKPVAAVKAYFTQEWKDIADSTGINFVHHEDEFDDLTVQPFLPHSLASQGPKIATGDLNGDGLQDFYICGAKNQPGGLYLQNAAAKFTQSLQACFIRDSAYEDTDAILFDADNDKDLDLYVTSGGNEFYGRNEWLQDRLYMNDGKGNFAKNSALTALYENKSCVTAADFDDDGDMDLFAGGRANARMYGYIPASVILQNDGRGNFKEVTQNVSPALINAGMVTGACWNDIDKDGWMDLIVVGEWMPVTIFKNTKGQLVKTTFEALKNSAGWWNCIYASDIDKDGDDDYLLGNWGTNSKLTATEKKPLIMYLSDWDDNGEVDPVMAINKNNNYYSFLGKSDLEKRLPYIKKRFLKYREMAGKNIAEIFGSSNIDKAKQLQAVTLQSSVLWNDKGSFRLQPLPGFLQVAPIFSFASFSNNSGQHFVAGGNFYEVQPYEGRYDAMLPTVFSFKDNAVQFESYINQKGCIRSIQPIQMGNAKNYLLMGNNNAALTMLAAGN
jgi:enediyne biosynthesis protein E4